MLLVLSVRLAQLYGEDDDDDRQHQNERNDTDTDHDADPPVVGFENAFQAQEVF